MLTLNLQAVNFIARVYIKVYFHQLLVLLQIFMKIRRLHHLKFCLTRDVFVNIFMQVRKMVKRNIIIIKIKATAGCMYIAAIVSVQLLAPSDILTVRLSPLHKPAKGADLLNCRPAVSTVAAQNNVSNKIDSRLVI